MYPDDELISVALEEVQLGFSVWFVGLDKVSTRKGVKKPPSEWSRMSHSKVVRESSGVL